MKVPVGVAAGGTMIPISWFIQPKVLRIRNTGTIKTYSGIKSTLKITKRISRRPGNLYFARAKPAIELAKTVSKLLRAATIKEFNAYRGISPLANTAWKFSPVNPWRSKFGGKTKRSRERRNAEKMAQSTGIRNIRQTTSALRS